MASGFCSDDGVFHTIQTTLCNGVDFARSQLPDGESEVYCLDCGDEIPARRRIALPGVKYCVTCKVHYEKSYSELYNRRGSKDSQLR